MVGFPGGPVVKNPDLQARKLGRERHMKGPGGLQK